VRSSDGTANALARGQEETTDVCPISSAGRLCRPRSRRALQPINRKHGGGGPCSSALAASGGGLAARSRRYLRDRILRDAGTPVVAASAALAAARGGGRRTPAHRRSGTSDLVDGGPAPARGHPPAEPLLGRPVRPHRGGSPAYGSGTPRWDGPIP